MHAYGPLSVHQRASHRGAWKVQHGKAGQRATQALAHACMHAYGPLSVSTVQARRRHSASSTPH